MFPDIANVSRIREALWRYCTVGSAAVMVGSGFSRNAEPAWEAPLTVRDQSSW